MAVSDPVIERIMAHTWPRGGVQVRRVRGGYTERLSAQVLPWLA